MARSRSLYAVVHFKEFQSNRILSSSISSACFLDSIRLDGGAGWVAVPPGEERSSDTPMIVGQANAHVRNSSNTYLDNELIDRFVSRSID